MPVKDKVLIIDNMKSQVEHLKKLLAPLDYPLEEIYYSEEALEFLERDPNIKLVLIEASLQSMDGYQLCSSIRKANTVSDLSLIIITPPYSPEDKARGFESGADDIVTRPLHGSELTARIKNLMEARAARRRLEDAYNSFHSILSYSGLMLDNFDPMWFKLEDVQKELFQQAFKGVDMQGSPESIYLYYPQDKGGNYPEQLFLWDGKELGTQKTSLSNWDKMPQCNSFKGYCYANYAQLDNTQENRCMHCLPSEVINQHNQVHNHIALVQDKAKAIAINFPQKVDDLHANMFKGLVQQSFLYKTLAEQTRQVKEAFIYTAGALARAAEAVDGETGNHIVRVSKYSTLLGEKLGLSHRELEELSYSSMMHDVGKMKIGPEILLKEGPLTKEEFREIENHTVYGVMILGDSPYLEVARQIALSHHEKWDGSGYPYGLKEEEISPVARIVALVDIYDALRSKRPYKPSFSHEKTCSIILEGDGRVEPEHFCPQVLGVFQKYHRSFEQIYDEYS